MNTHIVVFDAPISKARAARIGHAIRLIEASAYVICGSTAQPRQPGYVTVPGVVTATMRSALYEAATRTK